MHARGGSAVGVPGAGLAGHAPPDLRAVSSSRAAVAPDEEGDVQAAPWSPSSVTMGVAVAPLARRMKQRVASTPVWAASGHRIGSSPLIPAGSKRRGAPLAAGLRRPIPVHTVPTRPSAARSSNGTSGAVVVTSAGGARVSGPSSGDRAARGGVGGGNRCDKRLHGAGARPHTRADAAGVGVQARRAAAGLAQENRRTGVELVVASPSRLAPGAGGRDDRAQDADHDQA